MNTEKLEQLVMQYNIIEKIKFKIKYKELFHIPNNYHSKFLFNVFNKSMISITKTDQIHSNLFFFKSIKIKQQEKK
jgi:hypothetical protein